MARQIFFSCSDAGEVARCASVVKSGGIVVFPTDTIYGIGCDPFNDKAVGRIFAIKGRDARKALPVLAYSTEYAEKIVILGDSGRTLARKYWPGALTIVAPIRDRRISHTLSASSDSLGVRVPANRCTLSLLSHCNYIVGTSANRSGERSPKSMQEVLDSALEGYDALLDGGPAEKGRESTIVDVTGKPKIIREGAISAHEVMEALEKL